MSSNDLLLRCRPLCAALFVACGDSGSTAGTGVTVAGETACEQYASLAQQKGCAMPESCAILPECDELAQAWVQCVAQDLSQCLCEDGDQGLNCEGSFKANEGPAKCISEYRALNECQEQNDRTTEFVGEACLPEQIPETGFQDTEAYVETGSAQCGGEACLVYRVSGDLRPSCVPGSPVPCADPAAVQERVHCTCRCNAGDTGFDECVCPDGFSCVTILEQGGPEARGGYCVRNTQ